MKVALTSISVNNPIEAFKFYTEKLGFVKKMYMPEMMLAIVVSPEDPDGTAILLEPNGNLNSKEYEKLKSKGVVFKGEPKKTEFGTQVLFEDTCGNLIQLHQA